MIRTLKELFHIRFTVRNSVMLGIACALNAALFLMSYFLHLPFTIDLAGTAYIAFMLGPTAGIIAAIVNSFLQFIFYNVSALLYVVVGIAVALFIGICSRKRMFKDFFGALGIVFCCYAINVLVNSVIPLLISIRECDVWVYYFYNIFHDVAKFDVYPSSLLANVIMKLPDTLIAMGAVLGGYYVTPKKVRDEALEIHIDEY